MISLFATTFNLTPPIVVDSPSWSEWIPARSLSNLGQERTRVVEYDFKSRRDPEDAPGSLAEDLTGVPQSPLLDELSIPNPPVEPGPILTLSAEEITRFFVRSRRDQDTERWDVRLDAALGIGID